jgi:hypothetical protein
MWVSPRQQGATEEFWAKQRLVRCLFKRFLCQQWGRWTGQVRLEAGSLSMMKERSCLPAPTGTHC